MMRKITLILIILNSLASFKVELKFDGWKYVLQICVHQYLSQVKYLTEFNFSFYCQSCEPQLTSASIVKQWHLHC